MAETPRPPGLTGELDIFVNFSRRAPACRRKVAAIWSSPVSLRKNGLIHRCPRLFLALTLFCLGIYLVWDLWVSGFEVIVFVAVLACFMAAHYVKPKRIEEDGSSILWEVIDFLIDIPFKTIALLLRAIGRPLKSDVDGFDL